MLEINTIADFQALPVHQQSEILTNIKVKDRLENWLRSLNKKRERKPEELTPHWRPCKYCNQTGWRWFEVRDGSDVHPSQIHKCVRLLWYACNGFADQMEETFSAQTRMIFDLGHAWHHTVQSYGERGAWGDPTNYDAETKIDPNAKAMDGTPLLPLAERYWIRGSADAVVKNYIIQCPTLGEVSLRMVHEYKTMNSNQFTKLNRPKPEHKWQATIYSAVFDVPVTVFLYTNKDNCNNADFPVPFDASIWQEVTQKIEVVQNYTMQQQTPPMWELTSAALSPRDCQECGARKFCAPPPLSQIGASR